MHLYVSLQLVCQAARSLNSADFSSASSTEANRLEIKSTREDAFEGLPEVTTEDEGASPVTTGASDPSPEKIVITIVLAL